MKKASKEFQTRYDTAKKFRDAVEDEITEVLSYISPGREKDFAAFDTRPENRDEGQEIYFSMPENLATDFAADLVTYFAPSESRWTEYLVTAEVPEEIADQVLKIVNEREEGIWELIQSSNFNEMAPQVFFEAGHGTIAMWVERAHMSQPINVEAVTPEELLIAPGHLGILDRFRECWVMAEHLPARFTDWPEVDLSDEQLQRKINKPGCMVKVCYGFWVSWKDPGNPVWMCEITVDKKSVVKEPFELGPLAGACPLMVGRFNPQRRNPWGRGPGRKALPDMRVLNKLDEATLEGIEQSLSNTLIYADDGFLDLENGLEIGKAYAASRGFTREMIYEMNRGVNLDAGFISIENREQRLRENFYQDGPRQRGETPPTASQWVDERRRVQQRLGKPSAPLWTELLLPFIQRVEYIGVQMGEFDAGITHDGQSISVQPISPLQKATNQDAAMTARSNMDLAFGVFQENTVNVIDPVQTMKNIITATGDKLTVVRDEMQQPEAPNAPPPEGQ